MQANGSSHTQAVKPRIIDSPALPALSSIVMLFMKLTVEVSPWINEFFAESF